MRRIQRLRLINMLLSVILMVSFVPTAAQAEIGRAHV